MNVRQWQKANRVLSILLVITLLAGLTLTPNFQSIAETSDTHFGEDWAIPEGKEWKDDMGVYHVGISYQGLDDEDPTGKTLLARVQYHAGTGGASGKSWIYLRMDPELQPYITGIDIKATISVGLRTYHLRHFEPVSEGMTEWVKNDGTPEGNPDPYIGQGNVWRVMLDENHGREPLEGDQKFERTRRKGNWGVFHKAPLSSERYYADIWIHLSKPADEIKAEKNRSVYSMDLRIENPDRVLEETRRATTFINLTDEEGLDMDSETFLKSPSYHLISYEYEGRMMGEDGQLNDRLVDTGLTNLRIQHGYMVGGYSYTLAGIPKPQSFLLQLPLELLPAISDEEQIVVYRKASMDLQEKIGEVPIMFSKDKINPETGRVVITADEQFKDDPYAVYIDEKDINRYFPIHRSSPNILCTCIEIPLDTGKYMPVSGYKTLMVQSYMFHRQDGVDTILNQSLANGYINIYGYRKKYMARAYDGTEYDIELDNDGPIIATLGEKIPANDPPREFEGYTYESVDQDPLVITSGENVQTYYYVRKEVQSMELALDKLEYWSGEPIDSSLRAILHYKDGSEQTIPYDKFEENGIELTTPLNPKSLVATDTQVQAQMEDGSTTHTSEPIAITVKDLEIQANPASQQVREGDAIVPVEFVSNADQGDTVLYTMTDAQGLSINEQGELVGTPVLEWPTEPTDPNFEQQTITVTVTGQRQVGGVNTGHTDTAQVQITVVRDQNTLYEPVGKKIVTPLNKTPLAADGIANKDQLPENTQYRFKDPVDVSTPGTQSVTIVVQYPDGTEDEVTVQLEVTPHIIPVENPQNPPEKPEGYVTVEFLPGENGSLTGTQKYYVLSGAITYGQLEEPAITPDTGYEVATPNWDPDLEETALISADVQITARYHRLSGIIPVEDPENPPEKPAGYMEVSFTPGAHGSLTGTTVFYVNPKLGIRLGELTQPLIDPDTGYKEAEEKWSPAFDETKELNIVNGVLEYEAQYEALEDFYEVDPDNAPVLPKGYVEVNFLPGDNGSLTGPVRFHVNPEKNVKISQLTLPTIHPNTGYEVAQEKWNPALDPAAVITESQTFTAQYDKLEDIIEVVDPQNPPAKPDGYVEVKFLPGQNGSLTGTTLYYVNPEGGLTLAQIEEPVIQPNTGFKVSEEKWNPPYDPKTSIMQNLEFTAQYDKLEDVVAVTDPEHPPVKPEGYVSVRFLPGDHASLEGVQEYYVNPNAKKLLSELQVPTITPESGYVLETPNWSPAFVESTVIEGDLRFTAQVRKLTDAELYKGQARATVKRNEEVSHETISFEPALPEGAQIIRVNDIDTSHVGQKQGTVTVRFKDGSEKDVVLTVQVEENYSRKPIEDKQNYSEEKGQHISGKIEGAEPGLATDGTKVYLVDPETGEKLTYRDPETGKDEPIEGVIHEDGSFEIPIEHLEDGQKVRVVVREPDKEPAPSDQIITIDKTAPVAPSLGDPKQGQSELPLADGEAGSKVLVEVIRKDGSKETYEGTLGEDGSVNVPVEEPLQAGDIVKVTPKDDLGNVGEPVQKEVLPGANAVKIRVRGVYIGQKTVTIASRTAVNVRVEIIRDGQVLSQKILTEEDMDENWNFVYSMEEPLKENDAVRAIGDYGLETQGSPVILQATKR